MNLIQQPRRKFLQTGVAGFCTALFAGLPKISFAKSHYNSDKGIIVREDEGLHILNRQAKSPRNDKNFQNKEWCRWYFVCVEDQSPGRKMRIHKHLNNDALIFIHNLKNIL